MRLVSLWERPQRAARKTAVRGSGTGLSPDTSVSTLISDFQPPRCGRSRSLAHEPPSAWVRRDHSSSERERERGRGTRNSAGHRRTVSDSRGGGDRRRSPRGELLRSPRASPDSGVAARVGCASPRRGSRRLLSEEAAVASSGFIFTGGTAAKGGAWNCPVRRC